MTSNKILTVKELWQFYNLSPNLVCISGDNGYFNHVSPTFTQLLHFTEEELLNIPYLELIHPDDREETLNEINALKRGKAVSSFRNRCQMKGGKHKWLYWRANCSEQEGDIYAIGLDCTGKPVSREEIRTTGSASLTKNTGLIDAIKKLIEDTKNVRTIDFKFHSNNFSDGMFSQLLKLNILSIIDEQLKNILMHSRANSVQINLEQVDNNLFLSVQDNGIGFNKSKKKNGAGIANIISAAKQYDGEVFIDTAPGTGCTLSVVFIEPGLMLN
jgi:PAS domain S-box-containing protein